MIATKTTSIFKLIQKPPSMSPTINSSKVSKGTGQPIVFLSPSNNDTGNSNINPTSVLKLKQNDLTDMTFKGEHLQQLSTNALPPYIPIPPPIPVKKTYDVNCCCDCGDAFSLKSSLTFHLERRSVLIKFPCDACKVTKIFYNRCTLLSHIRSHTDKNETSDISRAVVNPLPRVFMDGLQTELVSALDEEMNNIDESRETPPSELLEFSLKETEDDSLVGIQNSISQNNSPKVKCLDCNEEFEDAEARKKHLTNDDKIPLTTSQCNTCGMLCPSKCNLKAHQRLHLQVSPYVCPECGDSPDYYWSKFQHHVRYKCFHNARNIGYKCPACKRVSPSNESLLKHMELHTEKYLKCTKCIRAYTSLPRFEDHIKEFHRETAKDFTSKNIDTIYKCSLCDIVFMQHDQMLKHRSTHLKDQVCEYVFNCMQCGKALENKALLLEHIKQSHAKVYKHFMLNEELENKPSQPMVTYRGKVECILCNSSFHSYQGYNVHLNRAHININQPCSYCYMIIGNRKEMIIHGKKHLKKGNIVCLLCNNKKCHDQKNLEMHLSYHVDKLVNCSACPICNELMPTSQNALEHLRLEHSLTESFNSSIGKEGVKLTVTCHFCRISFDNDCDLQDHINAKHNFQHPKRPLNMSAFQETETHSPKKPCPERNLCAKCKFTSSDRKVFKEHLLTHKTIKSTFQCQECGLCFIVESALVKHLKIIHKISDTKKYLEEEGCNFLPDVGTAAEVFSCDSLICNVCYKTFPTETALKTHMRSHGMAFIQANKSNSAN